MRFPPRSRCAVPAVLSGHGAEAVVYDALVGLQRACPRHQAIAVLPLPGVELRDAGVRTRTQVVLPHVEHGMCRSGCAGCSCDRSGEDVHEHIAGHAPDPPEPGLQLRSLLGLRLALDALGKHGEDPVG